MSFGGGREKDGQEKMIKKKTSISQGKEVVIKNPTDRGCSSRQEERRNKQNQGEEVTKRKRKKGVLRKRSIDLLPRGFERCPHAQSTEKKGSGEMGGAEVGLSQGVSLKGREK